MVQRYLTDVEQAEDKQLAAEDAKAQEAQAAQMAAELSPASGTTGTTENDDPPADMFSAKEGRWGSGAVRIRQVTLEGPGGPAHLFHTGDPMTIRMQITASDPVDDFAFGVSIFTPDGICCYGTNTDIEEMRSKFFHGDAEVVFAIDRLDLVQGTYKLDVAVHKRDGFSYDYHRLLHTFRVKSRTRDAGIYRPSHVWRFTDNVQFKEPDDRSDD